MERAKPESEGSAIDEMDRLVEDEASKLRACFICGGVCAVASVVAAASFYGAGRFEMTEWGEVVLRILGGVGLVAFLTFFFPALFAACLWIRAIIKRRK